ncbi:DUF3108 domain-containing protein [Rubrivivax gelatinosus]|uniref:DUF3108 domain-containing protein n=1 Tax=Rubrivivax gelatinosus TaxID=28068 RepID=A0ABS1DRX1_RUBGE|nr:DUF3108 domain-containing protein [Rubrivivax gelatinosus]MBK1712238.1 hypothetical protein [Rubrivivax gelatinosus]
MERGTRRRLALAALALALVALHLELADSVLSSGLALDEDLAPKRLDVSFVQTLQPSAPPPVRVAPPPPKPQPRAPVVAEAAEAAASAASEPDVVEAAASAASAPPELPPVGDDTLALADPLPPAASAASAASLAASGPDENAVPFEWPPSTQIAYDLNGNYRGPVQGEATVEWLREGARYQVNLEVSIGPSFAPLVTRRLSSDGEITEHGLKPRRYDEVTRTAFRDPKHQSVRFEDGLIYFANGRTGPALPGVQDTASQFVQMTWLFTTQPALLQPGRSVQLPLALPRHADTWTYDVIGHETLHTRFGEIDTLHVKPRRAPRPGKELTVEMWVAPTLQYLPVRIVIRQDDDTWVDLLIRRLPRQSTPS